MNSVFRMNAIVAAALILISPSAAPANPRSYPLDEDAASDLLMRTLKHDRIYAKRISLGCLACGTEETTDAYFQFYLREIHNAKCGGAPEVEPIVGRYRVYRRSGKIERWKPSDDSWHPYDPAKIK
jgi:hypothetical protein